MRTRFHLCLIGAAFVACLAAPALAQTPPKPGPETPAPDAKGEWVQPPAKLPNVAGDPTRNLDLLFKALKAAPSDEIAKAIEHRIWAVWAVSRSDTTNLLMTRVRTAFEKHEVDLALKLLDAIVKIKPDYVEAWNRRATIHFTKKDYGRALADLREVLKREPRHFGALSGLAQIMALTGHKQSALEAWQKVLAIYPMLRSAQDQVATLSEELAGEGI
jgi:tetratricopeptide (TPR) repeat protein